MKRQYYLDLVHEYLDTFPVCAILGARQVGKTTLARDFADEHQIKNVEFFDLENNNDLQRLDNPMATLSKYDGYLIVIDEIQRRPDLFPMLRVLVDDPYKKYSFLILGSASKELIRQSSETLAGRIGYIELPPFTLFDLLKTQTSSKYSERLKASNDNIEISDKLLIRGGFPDSYLASSDKKSMNWRQAYIHTFLEKDLANFGFNVSPQTMHKFWMMLCFYHGQTFNGSEIGKSLMISHKTAGSYLDILAGTFMIRILQPWHENIQKRQVKTPKIYFRDSGIFNALLSINSIQELSSNPKIGQLWEGFALEQVINCFKIYQHHCYFWATSNEAELDLLVFHNGKRIGFEFKYNDAPKTTKSMHIALQDLKLDHLYVIYPGTTQFPLTEKITACGLVALHSITL